jgi:hypothetical protein
MADRIHDFTEKLRQPAVLPNVVAMIERQRTGQAAPHGPISINLDLTTACNYECDHCIDLEILNNGRPYDLAVMVSSLEVLRAAGLESVILIGGGEPTLHPGFGAVVEHAKRLGLSCGIVSNGSRNDRIRAVSHLLTKPDWIRLSLDSGTDETFQLMHRPRRPISLAAICAGVRPIKEANPDVPVGFSFIISWADPLYLLGKPIHENVDEIVLATRLARDSGFDYISFKPLLQRDPAGAETVRFPGGARGLELRERIQAQLTEAMSLATSAFAVVGSTNLRAIEDEGALRTQPNRCYMHLMRQVLTPQGVFGCPAYRGNPRDKLGAADSYATEAGLAAMAGNAVRHMESFDPSVECRNISCIYSGTNWWLDGLASGAVAPVPSKVETDFFL